MVIHLLLFYLLFFSFYKRFGIGKTIRKSGLCGYVLCACHRIMMPCVFGYCVCSRSTNYTALDYWTLVYWCSDDIITFKIKTLLENNVLYINFTLVIILEKKYKVICALIGSCCFVPHLILCSGITGVHSASHRTHLEPVWSAVYRQCTW